MNRIKLTTDYIYNEKISKELTIAHMADIHFSHKTNSKELTKIIQYLEKLAPNYIMITGDIIDEPAVAKSPKIKEFVAFLNTLAKNCKVLISLGNHDIILAEDIKFFNKLDELPNIYILNNKNYHDEYINVTGLTLPNSYYYNFNSCESVDALINFLDNDVKDIIDKSYQKPNVLLVHSPIKLTNTAVLERLKNYDLILCGHTHAGLVPEFMKWLFPKNSGIISPHKRFFPEIAKGKIIKNTVNHRQTIIINGGIRKLSNRSGISFLNFIYNIDINKIILTKERGKKYE